jgi:2-polyprenyl-3-methyl-5-hydroxy-6-metoxy-1,4-benzoquinol methylase
VLDIGCGSGAIGRALKERGFSAVDAIEINAEARQAVGPIYRRLEASLDPYLVPASEAARVPKYDAILLLDVIEHMAEPEAFVERCRSVLAPGGLLLISVPNITHWSVRLPMFFGRFEYTERGILDRTHLQFFTTERVRRLAHRNSGLELVRHDGSIAPAEFVLPQWVSNSSWFEVARRVRRFGAKLWPSLFAFQHVALFRHRQD